MNTFFPDNWSKERLQEEIASAFKNKVFEKSNIWDGTMSDGVTLRFHIDNGVIKTVYPIF